MEDEDSGNAHEPDYEYGGQMCYACGRPFSAWYFQKPICQYFSQPTDELGHLMGEPTCIPEEGIPEMSKVEDQVPLFNNPSMHHILKANELALEEIKSLRDAHLAEIKRRVRTAHALHAEVESLREEVERLRTALHQISDCATIAQENHEWTLKDEAAAKSINAEALANLQRKGGWQDV